MSLSPQFGSLQPTATQQILQGNYLQFNGAGAGANNFAQQFLPEVYEQEVERYGNRTLSGFLRMVGAEMPMSSDQVIWSEQNRLHISYTGFSIAADAANTNVINLQAADGNTVSVNDTVVLLNPANGAEAKCIVTVSNTTAGAGSITVQPYQGVGLVAAGFMAGAIALGTGVKLFVYGSDYGKGSQILTNSAVAGPQGNQTRVSVNPSFTQYSNSPIILRSQYTISGSDMSQIGWVEVATEDGTSGFLWYLKAESETRLRFEDYLEMSMVESEYRQGAAAAVALNPGTQGMFAAIQTRGNVEVGFTAAAGLDEFDAILKNLDTQGAIEENMLFLQRQTSLDFDDMLASISGGFAGGTAFGLFENSEEMALNLGFSGFRRGSYDFYKTDWKYLNDASTRGGLTGISSVEGVLVPAGTSTVYDQILGTNIRRPFLHVRYRASQSDDRRMKSWLTGSAGGASTSTLDAMEVNFLSERCLITQAANNFVLFKGI